mmetsp:Transcript_90853/g.256750  ORF Transcript_90853/g.256750 Transcript_90853/m.256750 type:complete len:393 (-) Transcript_90853:139-1317(-)
MSLMSLADDGKAMRLSLVGSAAGGTAVDAAALLPDFWRYHSVRWLGHASGSRCHAFTRCRRTSALPAGSPLPRFSRRHASSSGCGGGPPGDAWSASAASSSLQPPALAAPCLSSPALGPGAQPQSGGAAARLVDDTACADAAAPCGWHGPGEHGALRLPAACWASRCAACGLPAACADSACKSSAVSRPLLHSLCAMSTCCRKDCSCGRRGHLLARQEATRLTAAPAVPWLSRRPFSITTSSSVGALGARCVASSATAIARAPLSCPCPRTVSEPRTLDKHDIVNERRRSTIDCSSTSQSSRIAGGTSASAGSCAPWRPKTLQTACRTEHASCGLKALWAARHRGTSPVTAARASWLCGLPRAMAHIMLAICCVRRFMRGRRRMAPSQKAGW